MGDDWKPFASRSNGCGSACYADAANGTACPGSASCASRVGGFRTRASSIPGLTPALPSRTRGRSRMRENHTSGSVQGVPGNRHSYCDKMSHRGALLVVADTWEKGWLSAVKGVEVLPVAVVSGRHLAHNRPTGLHCHNPEISARAEMTAHTGASHPRTA